MPKRDKRVRIAVNLNPHLSSTVKRLSLEHDISPSEVIRDAARLLLETTQLRKDGFKIGGWRKLGDGSEEQIQIVNGY